MIKSLTLKNVGSLPDSTMDFGSRLNIITGDNGLGKSFLLDIIWYVLTNHWPVDINAKMTSGYMARPRELDKSANIGAEFLRTNSLTGTCAYSASYRRQNEAWLGKYPPFFPSDLVLYAHYDGSFSVWDPLRNYRSKHSNAIDSDFPPAFVLTPLEVWDGAESEHEGTKKTVPLCNGLIRDWVSWQDRGNREFSILTAVLECLSPSNFTICPAEYGRISTADARMHPFVRMPYGTVPAIWTSAGMRRILALAYMITWTLTEHLEVCRIRGKRPTARMTFLFDEVEAHLHPQWQRQIMNGIMGELKQITNFPKERYARNINVERGMFLGEQTIPYQGKPSDACVDWPCDLQIIAVTHSPLVMSSLESFFDRKYDRWLDMDVNANGTVVITPREFEFMGDATQWLTSEAFDLKSSYSVSAERAMLHASELLKEDKELDHVAIKEAYQDLLKTLNPKDPYLFRYRYLCERKGVKLS